MFFKLIDNKNNIVKVSSKVSFYKYSDNQKALITVPSDIADTVVIDTVNYKIRSNKLADEPTGPMEKGMTYMLRPCIQPL